MTLNLIGLILTSSLVSTIVSNLWISCRERRKREEEKNQKLYGALKFYLMLTGKLESIQDKVLDEKNKKIIPLAQPGSQYTNIQIREMEQPFYEIENELKKDWEKYAEKVLKLLEENSFYIDDKHWGLVSDIFETFSYQKLIYGEKVSVDLEKIRALTTELRMGKAMMFSIAIKNLRDALLNESDRHSC